MSFCPIRCFDWIFDLGMNLGFTLSSGLSLKSFRFRPIFDFWKKLLRFLPGRFCPSFRTFFSHNLFCKVGTDYPEMLGQNASKSSRKEKGQRPRNKHQYQVMDNFAGVVPFAMGEFFDVRCCQSHTRIVSTIFDVVTSFWRPAHCSW